MRGRTARAHTLHISFRRESIKTVPSPFAAAYLPNWVCVLSWGSAAFCHGDRKVLHGKYRMFMSGWHETMMDRAKDMCCSGIWTVCILMFQNLGRELPYDTRELPSPYLQCSVLHQPFGLSLAAAEHFLSILRALNAESCIPC